MGGGGVIRAPWTLGEGGAVEKGPLLSGTWILAISRQTELKRNFRLKGAFIVHIDAMKCFFCLSKRYLLWRLLTLAVSL